MPYSQGLSDNNNNNNKELKSFATESEVNAMGFLNVGRGKSHTVGKMLRPSSKKCY